MNTNYPPAEDGRWQTKPNDGGKPGRVKKGVQGPKGSGPFQMDEITKGYRRHPLDTTVNTAGAAHRAGKNIEDLLHR